MYGGESSQALAHHDMSPVVLWSASGARRDRDEDSARTCRRVAGDMWWWDGGGGGGVVGGRNGEAGGERGEQEIRTI